MCNGTTGQTSDHSIDFSECRPARIFPNQTEDLLTLTTTQRNKDFYYTVVAHKTTLKRTTQLNPLSKDNTL